MSNARSHTFKPLDKTERPDATSTLSGMTAAHGVSHDCVPRCVCVCHVKLDVGACQ